MSRSGTPTTLALMGRVMIRHWARAGFGRAARTSQDYVVEVTHG